MHLSRKYGMKKGDFIIIALVLALAAAIFVPYALAPSSALTCEIVQNGVVVKQVRMGAGYRETITLEARGITNIIEIEEDGVSFTKSNCPDQVCVRTGRLTRAGQTAVCLPTRVVVRLIGAGSDVDAIVR